MKRITLQPQPISKGLLEHLEDKGLIRMFRPTELTLNPPAGTNVESPCMNQMKNMGHIN